jgi:hypothetical protein
VLAGNAVQLKRRWPGKSRWSVSVKPQSTLARGFPGRDEVAISDSLAICGVFVQSVADLCPPSSDETGG